MTYLKIDSERLRRVFAAIVDPVSYRLLKYTWADRFSSLQFTKPDKAAPVNFGLPDHDVSSRRAPIPAVVFQTWKSRHEMPENYRYWTTSFRSVNPNFRCFLWDDADNRKFIAQRYPWFLAQYDSYPREIFRADIVRPFFLYAFGGFYADMDSECLLPLEEMRRMGDVLVGRMGTDKQFEHSIPNAIMASKPRQALWLLMIAIAADRFKTWLADRSSVRPEWLTGPILLKDAVDFYMNSSVAEVTSFIVQSCPELADDVEQADFGKIVILPSSFWYPVNWNNFLHSIFRRKMYGKRGVVGADDARKLFPKAYIVTYWTASWK